ncbi:MAG: hypothetical protein LC118_08125 [Dehalococcoidia bacterium]|nr:hypothetical protein [Dehalococcoidia bacterium]
MASYRGLVEALAEKVARSPQAKRVGAEYDDLVQEGLIDVWQALRKDITPSAQTCENRMRNWVKYLGSHGRAEYGTMLPIEDVRDLAREQDSAVGRTP